MPYLILAIIQIISCIMIWNNIGTLESQPWAVVAIISSIPTLVAIFKDDRKNKTRQTMNIRLLKKPRKRAKRTIWVEETIHNRYYINHINKHYCDSSDLFSDLAPAIKELDNRRRKYVIKNRI